MFTNPVNEIYNDILYFKSLYPDSISGIYRLVSDAGDKLEYDKSIMYDQYPDRERIRILASQIELSLPKNNPTGDTHFTRELIEVLLINEFLHRRIRRRHFQ